MAQKSVKIPTSQNLFAWRPSAYQQAVFEDVSKGQGHTVVVARAGSGKTTTIVKALNCVPKGCSTLVVAFNKAIAEELKTKVPPTCDALTLHSFGFAAIRNALGKIKVDVRKVFDLVANLVTDRRDRSLMSRVVGIAKGSLVDTPDDISEILEAHSFEPLMDRDRFVGDVLWTLDQCRNRKLLDSIDYDDMIWLPLILGFPVAQYDRVFIDETQDLNPAQIDLALKACATGGRICAVGDDRQSIYGFRGADRNAIPNLIERLHAKALPLSITYRCPKAVVRLAQDIVPDFEAADTAFEGTVVEKTYVELLRNVEPGDFVLSRANAPLTRLFFELVARGTPVKIAGRDVGAALVARIERSNATSVSDLLDITDKWQAKEHVRLAKKDPPGNTSYVDDMAECIHTIAFGTKSVEEAKGRIDGMFSDEIDDSERVILSTTHKAKGLERDVVWVLRSTYRKRKNLEEENLWYVAITRAKRELYLIDRTP